MRNWSTNLKTTLIPSSKTYYANNKKLFYIGPSLVIGAIMGDAYNKNINQKSNLLDIVLASNESINNSTNKRSKKLNYIADAVEIAAPAVVHIEVTQRKVTIHNPRHGHVISSNGSGFIATENGMILTNHHVVSKAYEVEVKLTSGETYKGVVIDVDEEKDLAAVKLITKKENIKFPHVGLGSSSELRPGELVAALGSPLKLSNTVTAGIISSLHRPSEDLGMKNKDMLYIQTDAAINVGNSGGPLINLDGEVIGINCITVQQAAGISFAIPSDIAKEFLQGAIEKEKQYIQNGGVNQFIKHRHNKFYIGVTLLTLTPEIILGLQQRNPQYFGNLKRGVYIACVNPGSPSERSGLLNGDIVIGINDNDVSESGDIYKEVKKGDSIVMKIIRNGKTIHCKVEPEILSKL